MKRNAITLKIITVICAVLLILSVLSVTVCVADSEGVTAWVICHPSSFVNARRSPSGKSECIGRFEAGDKVVIDGTFKNGFAHSDCLDFEYGEGWIAGYLVYDQPVRKSGDWYYVSAKGRVAARKCVDGQRLCWLKPMTELQVIWWSEEWCLTNKGMVKTEYLEENPR